MGKINKILFLTGFIAVGFISLAQDFPYRINYYKFINYNSNYFIWKGNSLSQYDSLFTKFNELAVLGNNQIHIFHLGDSHVQADFFPGEMRKRMQNLINGGISSRGFIFPYHLAKTNNPPDYKSSSNVEWERCRNVSQTENCELGIAGINIYTNQFPAEININFNLKDFYPYSFNKLKIFYNINDDAFDFQLANFNGNIEKKNNFAQGYTEIKLDNYLNQLEMNVVRCDTTQKPFILSGIVFENDDPGIIYSSVGVNGAETRSFFKCSLLIPQLKAIAPSWIIVSLGTNDAYPKAYSEKLFYNNYDSLLTLIRSVCPSTPILLTTPGDSYRANKVLNTNNISAGTVILKLAEKHNAAVWDFFKVMGGLGSINRWNESGMTNKDRLHLSKKGYIFQGDLLFNAFLNAYDNFINRNSQRTWKN